MDPLTATITIAGGIQTIFSFASALKTYIDGARSAKEDLKKLVATIESVFSAIEELQALLEQNKATGYWNDYGVVRARKCIADGYFIVGKLGHVLLKSGTTLDENVAENINSSIFVPFVWPIYRSQVQELNTELILLKLDIGTAHTTYRSQTWTAEEKVKGTELLKKYQQSREIFMSQLQALKEERRDIEEDSEDSDAGSSVRKLGREEKRIFDEWEEAVAERLRLERRLGEAEAVAQQKKEQQIRDDFVKQLETAAADRQMELARKRQEMEKLIESQDIPPKDKERIIESAIQTFHPVTQDSELVQALINRSDPPKARLPSELTLGISNGAIKPTSTGDKKRRNWSWRRLRGTSSNPASYFDTDIPILLRDPAAPGGRAVLYAAHFTPDPYGQYRGIEIEALSLWAKCATLSNNSSELTAEFMFLPENCKSAILRLLNDLTSASKDYTWNMLLVYQAQSKARKRRFGTGRSQGPDKDSAGIFAIFKRHLRQHHGINSSAAQPIESDDTLPKPNNSRGIPQGVVQEQSPVEADISNSREQLLPDEGDPIIEQSSQPRRRRMQSQHIQTEDNGAIKVAQDDNRGPKITLIEHDGAPTYRVPLRGMNQRDFVMFRSLSCRPDPDDPGYLLILADVPQQAIHDAVRDIYMRNSYGPSYGPGSGPKDFPPFQFVPSADDVLNERAALLQQRRKEEAIRTRMMGNRRFDDRYESLSPLRNASRWDRANANIYDLDGRPRPPIIPQQIYLDRSPQETRNYGPHNEGAGPYRFREDDDYIGHGIPPPPIRRRDRDAYYDSDDDLEYRRREAKASIYRENEYRDSGIATRYLASPSRRTRNQEPTARTSHRYIDEYRRGRPVVQVNRMSRPFSPPRAPPAPYSPPPPLPRHPEVIIVNRRTHRKNDSSSSSSSLPRRLRADRQHYDIIHPSAATRQAREREDRRKAKECAEKEYEELKKEEVKERERERVRERVMEKAKRERELEQRLEVEESAFAERMKGGTEISNKLKGIKSNDTGARVQSPEATDVMIDLWTSKSSKPARKQAKTTSNENVYEKPPFPPPPPPPPNVVPPPMPAFDPLLFQKHMTSNGSDTVAGADEAADRSRDSRSSTPDSEDKVSTTNGEDGLPAVTAKLAYLREKMQKALDAGDFTTAADLQLYAIPEAEARLQDLQAVGIDVIESGSDDIGIYD